MRIPSKIEAFLHSNCLTSGPCPCRSSCPSSCPSRSPWRTCPSQSRLSCPSAGRLSCTSPAHQGKHRAFPCLVAEAQRAQQGAVHLCLSMVLPLRMLRQDVECRLCPCLCPLARRVQPCRCVGLDHSQEWEPWHHLMTALPAVAPDACRFTLSWSRKLRRSWLVIQVGRMWNSNGVWLSVSEEGSK